ncbi:MAG TPA: sporulation protein YqfD [Firmicutes bacterium]|jgi:similar to stage IV sporulation protein|nr:sporulation protein YqfD [Bacillota bacterium]
MTSYGWMWWQGYVTVRLRGPGLERLLNKIADLDIGLHKVERLTADVIIIRLRVRDFRRLRPLLRGTRINVSILDKHGAAFLIRKFRLRAFFAVGLVASVLLILYLGNFLWFIEVTGLETLPLEALKMAAEELGLRAGTAKCQIQPRAVEAGLMKRFPSLVWADVRLNGVKAEIRLGEGDGLQSEYGTSGQIYAKKDGLVTEIRALRGTPQVREGATVRQGDLLIAGVYSDARGQKQFGAAQGIVKARVWYEGVGETALLRWEPIPTGRNHTQYVLSIGPITIPLGRSYARDSHLVEGKDWNLYLGRAMVPIRWTRLEYQEVERVSIRVADQEAERAAYALAWESLMAQGVSREAVLEERHRTDLIIDGDGLRVTVQVEVQEDIGLFLSQ